MNVCTWHFTWHRVAETTLLLFVLLTFPVNTSLDWDKCLCTRFLRKATKCLGKRGTPKNWVNGGSRGCAGCFCTNFRLQWLVGWCAYRTADQKTRLGTVHTLARQEEWYNLLQSLSSQSLHTTSWWKKDKTMNIRVSDCMSNPPSKAWKKRQAQQFMSGWL